MSNTKPKSIVWNFYSIIDGDDRRVECKFCFATIVKSACRLKYHLIKACANCPEDTRRQCIDDSKPNSFLVSYVISASLYGSMFTVAYVCLIKKVLV